ncbi:small secreted protein [Actinacidiphila guanduensis]|uniref:Small secreted protein n=1 Tax=Actinacidiphila guanduensis TaxID=310781 RepID=A0A1H0P197_9ACTN|nr:small secreted protein [Actinacidiphila guanduensis]SDO98619.1 hypothetical protein SAMN05216259_11513 [Actinacidiphila guanduensis]
MKVNTRVLAALSGGLAVLLAVSACGDDTGKKRDEWAKGVCDQAAVQIKKIDDSNNSLGQVDSGGKPADVQSADAAAFQSAADAFGSLSAIFTKAGPAPGDDGKTFQQNAVTVFHDAATQYAGLKKQIDGLDTRHQAKFADGLKNVSASLQKASAAGQKSRDSLRQGDVGQALAKQPGCRGVVPTASAS